MMRATYIAIAMAGLCVAASERRSRTDLDDQTPPSSPNKTMASESRANLFRKAVLTSSTEMNNVLSMKAAMEATYRALPKNQHGLLSRSAASYLVQKYTMQVHQYSITGLGSDPLVADGNASASNEKDAILQNSAPEILGALLESRQGGHGLTLHDVATLPVMLHMLVRDHAVEVMHQAFDKLALLGMLPEDGEGFSVETLVKLVWVWQWLHGHDWKLEWDLLVGNMREPTRIMVMYGVLAVNLARTKFYQERDLRNPFKPPMLSMADVVQLASQTTARMGEWSADECRVMKKQLVGLDPDGDGRVPLDVLYDQPMVTNGIDIDDQLLPLSEDEGYLRDTGALDKSIPKHPQLLISNYILGPANCVRSTALHAFCCLNECDAVLSNIERAVNGSSARPDVLAALLKNLTTPSMDEPQPFSEVLEAKLSDIAGQNHGRVPLHGRLFMQWLHFAFPYECPYPHTTQKDEAGKVLRTSYFQGTAGDMVGWLDDEMLPFVDVVEPPAVLDHNLLPAVFMMLALGAMFNQVYMMARAHRRNMQTDVLCMKLKK